MSAKNGVKAKVSEAGPGASDQSRFDASRYLRKLGGRDYLEVKWRLLWLRTEHPDAVVTTELIEHQPAEGMAVFRARVVIPGGGEATGWGHETVQDFHDYLEKAETKALGRALAALGYGTQFCEDFDFSVGASGTKEGNGDPTAVRVVDAPVELPPGRSELRPEPRPSSGGPRATEPQVRAIYSIARSTWGLAEEEIEQRCKETYGCLPTDLSRRQASELIDSLKRAIGERTAS